MQLLLCCDKSLLHLFLWLFFCNNYVSTHNTTCIIRTSRYRTFFPFVILSVLPFVHLQLIFVAHLANLVASGNGIVFFCKISHALSLFYKDLLHIWQVFPIDNAVRQISRRKCKFFIKKELFKTVILFPVLIPILIYQHSDGNWSEWREGFSPNESDTYSQMTLCYCKMIFRLQ